MSRMPQPQQRRNPAPYGQEIGVWQFLDRIFNDRYRFRRFIVLMILLVTAVTQPEAVSGLLHQAHLLF